MSALAVRYGSKAETKKKTAGGSAGAPVASGTFELGTSRTTVEIGFKPKYLCVWAAANQLAINTYNADVSTTQARYSGGSTNSTSFTIGSNTSNYHLYAITDTGFQINRRADNVTSTAYYFAIGYAPGE
jgi:hypothetical protein